jgi:hypothetical protein
LLENTSVAYNLTSGKMSLVSQDTKFKCAICQLLPKRAITSGYPVQYEEEGAHLSGEQKEWCPKGVSDDGIEWPAAAEGRLTLQT